MKNTQGQAYNFELVATNTWILTGEPTLQSIVFYNDQGVNKVDLVNYSGNLTLSRGNHINDLQIQEINYISGVVQYVTQ